MTKHSVLGIRKIIDFRIFDETINRESFEKLCLHGEGGVGEVESVGYCREREGQQKQGRVHLSPQRKGKMGEG